MTPVEQFIEFARIFFEQDEDARDAGVNTFLLNFTMKPGMSRFVDASMNGSWHADHSCRTLSRSTCDWFLTCCDETFDDIDVRAVLGEFMLRGGAINMRPRQAVGR